MQKIGSRAILLWTVMSFLMVLHFFLLLSVGVITTELRDALKLSALELSILSSSYLYVYILLQTPAGILLDEYGPRKLLTIGAIICSIGCWLFAYSTSLPLAVVARVLMGGGLAFVFISSILLAGRWFAARYLGFMIGLAEAAGMVGSFVGSMLLAIFISKFGWRNSFYLAAKVSLIMAGLIWLFVHDSPDGKTVSERKKLNVKKVKAALSALMREPQIWLHSAYLALMYATITVFAGLWANPFLRRAFDLSLEQATFACCLVLAGIGIGSPIAGILCHTQRAQALCIQICAIAMFVIMCLVLYVPTMSLVTINILMFALGASGSSLILSFAIVSKLAPEGSKSTSVGFVNAISLVSAIIFQPVIGWLLNFLATGVGEGGLEFYTASDYRMALSVLPTLIFFAFLVSINIARRPITLIANTSLVKHDK